MHHVSANFWAAGFTIVALFGGAFIAGHAEALGKPYALTFLIVSCGSLLIGLDLLLRLINLIRSAVRNTREVVHTVEGIVPRTWPVSRELLDCLFSPERGAQYFHVVPAWAAGTVLIGARLLRLF